MGYCRYLRLDWAFYRLEEVARMVQQYITQEIPLFICVYGEYQDTEYHAKITKYDPQLQKIKLVEQNEEFHWISVYDIVDIYL